MSSQVPLGFHWFADDRHFGLEALERFLPHLTRLGAGWLVLRCGLDPVPTATAFAARLRRGGIEPLLHLLPGDEVAPERVGHALAPWIQGGVRYVALDDRPNLATRWSRWQPHGLPERYARWLAPALRVTADLGATPLFPPLAPGGDYWHTTFLEEALGALRAIGGPWLPQLGVGCVTDPGDWPVTWGRGGPARWGRPGRARASGQEDGAGFSNWEWAQQIAEQVLGRPVEVLALRSRLPVDGGPRLLDEMERLLQQSERPPRLGIALYLLASEPHGPERADAWFLADGTPLRAEAQAARERRTRAALRAKSAALPATLRLLRADRRVESIPLERYLAGVVASAMAADSPVEALKAQAVAARSYAARAIHGPRHAAEGADLCTTAHCQPWQGAAAAAVLQAVEATRGMVLRHDGHVIHGYSFDRCAGRTRASEEQWHTALPYCRSVPCVHRPGPLQGHGVGLCRHGAIQMAGQGAGCEDILRYFFTGITIDRTVGVLGELAGEERPSRPPRIEREAGNRAIGGTLPTAGVTVTVEDPWGNRYLAVSGSHPEVGANGWQVRVPVDALYRVSWGARRVEVAVRNDRVLVRAT